tara:strand:- start:171 stop:464 length:294 start_codon:yes stop_codon:yes gene_type:complete
LGVVDIWDRWTRFVVQLLRLVEPAMIMAFLLIMVVDGTQIDTGKFHFRNAYRCNQMAYLLESGAISPVDKRRVYQQQNKISAYCIPVKTPRTTTFYD